MEPVIPLAQLSRELGVSQSNARKIVKDFGVVPTKRQVLALGHHQRTSCFTREQADLIIAERRRRGFETPGPNGQNA